MTFFKKKSLGQNFLIDKRIVNKIIDMGKIESSDVIIEVGPGNGILTQEILNKKPKNLTVIEKDERLISILKEKFKNKINIINEDMMKVSYQTFLVLNYRYNKFLNMDYKLHLI